MRPQGFPGILRELQGYSGRFQEILGIAKVTEDLATNLGYLRLPRVPRLPGFPRDPEGVLDLPWLRVFFLMYAKRGKFVAIAEYCQGSHVLIVCR